jgi:hypothetical protein
LLNDDLEIHSYDREDHVQLDNCSSISKTFNISNVLKLPPLGANHLATKVEVPNERSVNLVLKSQTEMLITHIVIYAGKIS